MQNKYWTKKFEMEKKSNYTKNWVHIFIILAFFPQIFSSEVGTLWTVELYVPFFLENRKCSNQLINLKKLNVIFILFDFRKNKFCYVENERCYDI